MASRIFMRSRLLSSVCRPLSRQPRISRNYTTPPPPPSSSSSSPSRLTRISVGILIGTLGGTTFAWWDDKYNDRTVTRNLRTAYNGIMIAVDYKMNFDPDSLDSINALHERCAARLLDVCEKNRGLYVKLAQALATQGAFLPKPYARLAKLLDDAEQFDFDTVRQTVERELGAPLEELFVRFDSVPIAAASIAQVHRARIRLPDGGEEEVAVKVQRPDIRRHAKWDLWAYRSLLRLYEYFFDIPLSFAAQYISDQLMQETQFDVEASNSERIRSLVLTHPASSPLIRNTVYVPRIHPHLCTPRLLTMEYIEGGSKLTDLKAIKEKGLDVKKVARSTAEVFSAQIFEYGFVQADGHPSNVLVRKHPNGKKGQHQIVLIDHGLYIPLTSSFRQAYSELWYALIVQDLDAVRRIGKGWGIGQAELFASATLLKPWRGKMPSTSSSFTSSSLKGSAGTDQEVELTPEEKKKIEDERALAAQRELKQRLKTFLTDVELIPKELVFIGRAMRILQANNQAMGSPVNRLNILAKHASLGLLQTSNSISSPSPSPSTPIPRQPLSSRLSSYISTRLTFLRFRTTLLAIDLAFYVTHLIAWTSDIQRRVAKTLRLGSREAEGGKRFEDRLENELRDIARTKFGMQISDDAWDS